MAQKGNAMTDVLMLVGGGVVGAGLGLLFAPQSGVKCRKEIARFGRSMSKKSERAYRDLSDNWSDLADTVSGKVSLFRRKIS